MHQVVRPIKVITDVIDHKHKQIPARLKIKSLPAYALSKYSILIGDVPYLIIEPFTTIKSISGREIFPADREIISLMISTQPMKRKCGVLPQLLTFKQRTVKLKEKYFESCSISPPFVWLFCFPAYSIQHCCSNSTEGRCSGFPKMRRHFNTKYNLT